MSAERLPSGGSAIDRSRPLTFSFDGREIQAFQGDTIASALLANDVAVVGRSFKYHRPRGVWGAGVEEPNALVDITGSGPNMRATTELVRQGLIARSVNAAPDAASDRHAFLDRFARFIPAAFYYKTFMWPNWHRFEPRIRAMAGLGKVDPAWTASKPAQQINRHCDVLVVGAGPAGLAAAKRAADAGRSVILADDQVMPGGSLLHRESAIDGRPGPIWAEETVAALKDAGHLVLASTTAFGIYDHHLVALNQRHHDGRPDALWRVRPRRIILATGAIERPLPFVHNDLPGIMSADAALIYLRRYGVRAGHHVVVATNNDGAYEAAGALAKAGAEVVLVEMREGPLAAAPEGIRRLSGRRIASAGGRMRVESVMLDDGLSLPADCVLVSGGPTPTIHLYCQAGGKPRWDEARAAFLPGDPVEGLSVAGAARGAVALSDVFASAVDATASLGGTKAGIPVSTGPEASEGVMAAWPQAQAKGRVWIDYQSDVTAKDIELAARENFISVEHLKRYTTLGMATDQGKTSNLPGLALMAGITRRSVPETGLTTYRPPFTPVPFTSFTGVLGGELMAPVRRLPLETMHRAMGAVFQEYGGWLRPAHYGGADAESAIQEEARRARQSVALFDGSSLGKIEVMGPRAAEFADFIYYNTMSTLLPGRCRYGFMLAESGIVFDDGVLVRLDEHRFVVSCSSSHVAAVHARLEEWRQDRFGRDAVYIHNITAEMATLAISGPRSKELLSVLDLGLSLDDRVLPHMAVTEGRFGTDGLRVARVSFTGDRSYELSIRADRADELWTRLAEAGRKLDAVTIGLEAMMILRAEKGYVVVGKDTDGTTMPQDLGVTGPRARRGGEYVGRRSLFTEVAMKEDRLQLVGLAVGQNEPPLAPGAHGIRREGGRVRSQGFITTSHMSPTLERPIALALIERGASRHGETIDIQHLGAVRRATIMPPCAFDPKGDRLNA
ncbi:MAG: sarcosine oxidase subunit alpha family protein [Parvibaculaceae bacterium]